MQGECFKYSYSPQYLCPAQFAPIATSYDTHGMNDDDVLLPDYGHGNEDQPST